MRGGKANKRLVELGAEGAARGLTFDNINATADDIIDFLRQLKMQLRGPFTLIWDGSSIHSKSRKVRAYLAGHPEIVVETLPGYAPELNPVEYFWSALKGKPFANLAPDTITQLEQAIQRNHRKMRKRPDALYEFLVASSLFEDDMPVKTSGESQ